MNFIENLIASIELFEASNDLDELVHKDANEDFFGEVKVCFQLEWSPQSSAYYLIYIKTI